MLDEQGQNECERLLTEAEWLESLKSMESNKSPGSDSLPAEFYKVFWNDVHHYLLNTLNCAYAKGLLAVTQRRGLITLLPKKNKPANFLKNWRPIEGLRAKRAYIEFWPIFIFLQDRADFWQTDLF